MRNSLLVIFALVLAIHSARAHEPMTMGRAALELRSSLSEKQLKKFQYDYEDKSLWNFLPTFRFGIMKRKGIALKSLDEVQTKKVLALLGTAMSLVGEKTVATIRELDGVLKQDPGIAVIAVKYDPDLYYVSLFGDPDSDLWSWRFEGHHLSLNFTVVNGVAHSRAPTFMGAFPQGQTHLPEFTQRALRLAQSLSQIQRVAAMPSNFKLPSEVVLQPREEARPLDPKGISFADLQSEQQENLIQVIRAYTDQFKPELAQKDWDRFQNKDLHFLWAGEIDQDGAFYYRIQSGSFVLEYDHSNGDPEHIHTVWRDLGEATDPLLDHYLDDH